MILMYHKVDLDSPTIWWVDVNNFYRQMLELRSKKVVYLDDYDPGNKDHVVITFDGIYTNVFKYAAPILKMFNYPFELFFTSEYLGKNNDFDTVEPYAEFVNVNELQQLIQYGGRLQWHTKTHMNLKSTDDRDIIVNELTVPESLRKLDSEGFKWFAYPHGEFNEIVLEETQNRFVGAVSCDQGDSLNPYQLNRITVKNDISFRKNRVAVIIASYNYGAYLIEAIESVLRQTYPPDEILISDDASTDNTFDIASAYQKKYPNLIKVNRNETNLGIVNHFNKAIGLTTSEYICFLGADNRFRSDYLEKCVEILDEEEQVAIAYTDFGLFGPRAKVVYDNFKDEYKGEIKDHFYIINFPKFTEDSKRVLLEGNNFIHGSSMYKRQAYIQVGGYFEKDDIPEDYNLFLRMIKAGWTAKKIPHPLLEYRQHSEEQANVKMITLAELKFYKEQFGIKDKIIEQRDADIGLLKSQVEALLEGNKWYEKQGQEKDEGIQWLQNQLEEHKKSIEWLQKQLEEQTAKVECYRQQKEELEKSLSLYKDKEQELQGIISAKKEKQSELRQDLSNLKDELNYYHKKSILKWFNHGHKKNKE